jgi:hypothetical protein
MKGFSGLLLAVVLAVGGCYAGHPSFERNDPDVVLWCQLLGTFPQPTFTDGNGLQATITATLGWAPNLPADEWESPRDAESLTRSHSPIDAS